MATAKKRKTTHNEKAKSPGPTGSLGLMLKTAGEWGKSIIVAVLVALAIRWVFLEPFRIPSGSMEPTFFGNPSIFRGDRVWVNKFVYGTRYPLNGIRIPRTSYHLNYAESRLWPRHKPERWDIVVFKSVEESSVHTTLVKRVVGLPGERIHIANGKVHADGVPLQTPPDMPPVEYTSPPSGFSSDMKYGILPEDKYSLVPEDSYLLLGDNSAQSRDGRYFGWVPYERILGRVSCIWLPVGRWRDFTGFSETWWWWTAVTAVLIFLVWRFFFGRSWRYMRGDKIRHVLINRWAYGLPMPFTRIMLASWGKPRRGDFVLYAPPAEAKNAPHLLVGRIAGLPGERVFLDAGKLEVDGRSVDHLELSQRVYEAADDTGPYARSKGKQYSLVPEGYVFILTENDDPEDHLDSRTLGWTPLRNLQGRAFATWWPPHRIGLASEHKE